MEATDAHEEAGEEEEANGWKSEAWSRPYWSK